MCHALKSNVSNLQAFQSNTTNLLSNIQSELFTHDTLLALHSNELADNVITITNLSTSLGRQQLKNQLGSKVPVLVDYLQILSRRSEQMVRPPPCTREIQTTQTEPIMLNTTTYSMRHVQVTRKVVLTSL